MAAAPPSQRVGVGLVGLGIISRAHLAGYARAADHAAVVAVCDLDGDRAAAVARELGARAYTRLGDLLEDPDVTAVDLTLPHHVHYEAASAALTAGRHVLVEKPLALTSGECRSLIEQARAASLTLGVSGGGAILDSGPHSFYLLRWLLGELATVRAFHHRLIAESEVDDHAVVAGSLCSGALYSTEYTFTAEIPWGERFELYGSEGSVIVDQLSQPPVIHFQGGEDHGGHPLTDVPYNPAGWKEDSIAAGVTNFADAVRAGRAPVVTGTDGLHGVLVAERAYESAAAGGVELEFEDAEAAR